MRLYLVAVSAGHHRQLLWDLRSKCQGEHSSGSQPSEREAFQLGGERGSGGNPTRCGVGHQHGGGVARVHRVKKVGHAPSLPEFQAPSGGACHRLRRCTKTPSAVQTSVISFVAGPPLGQRVSMFAWLREGILRRDSGLLGQSYASPPPLESRSWLVISVPMNRDLVLLITRTLIILVSWHQHLIFTNQVVMFIVIVRTYITEIQYMHRVHSLHTLHTYTYITYIYTMHTIHTCIVRTYIAYIHTYRHIVHTSIHIVLYIHIVTAVEIRRTP